VNDYAAETRRMTRFWDYGHTPGEVIRPPLLAMKGKAFDKPILAKFNINDATPRVMAPPMEELSTEYPFTLDLRNRSR
jgi:hypothetical protein